MSASRREFLTGEAALRAARESAARLAARDDADQRPLPHSGDTVRLETRAMACPWAVLLEPGRSEEVMIASEALDEVHRIEALLSVYRPNSAVSILNREAAGAPQEVSEELFHLLTECRRLWKETGGAFDPATQSLLTLWSRCRSESRVPADDEIATALYRSGMDHVVLHDVESTPGDSEGVLSPRVSFTTEGTGLNFGAIGKGYAIDRAAAILRERGMETFLVHGGFSSLRGIGGHAGQAGWPVGLKNPLFTDEAYLTLMIRDRALATSGSNVQFYRHQGRRYGHILDPRTGRPAEGLLSVSVLAETAAEADAVSTALYVLGLERAIDYCEAHPTIGAILTPPPQRGRELAPILKNLDPSDVFVTSRDVALRF